MLEINPALPVNLTELLAPPCDATKPTAEPPTDFQQLLQGLTQAEPPPESALPELLAVVASLTGLDLPGITPGIKAAPSPKEKPSESTSDAKTQSDPTTALQVLFGVPQICIPKVVVVAQGGESDEPSSEAKRPLTFHQAKIETPELAAEAETEAPAAKQTLNLKDFDVRRFEFKTELEIATVQPKLIRVSPLPGILQPQSRPNPLQPRTAKASSPFNESAVAVAPALEHGPDAPLITAPEAVERVRVVIDPPPPPPVARVLSIDIGDAESQVRVVLRERGGQLAVQFGAATERLREDLQNASPLLMHELRRDNTHSNVTLDFSNFGSATDAGHESQQDAPRKKPLKSEAVFADLDETAYLEETPPFSKSF
jgi:hypothetical protein